MKPCIVYLAAFVLLLSCPAATDLARASVIPLSPDSWHEGYGAAIPWETTPDGLRFHGRGYRQGIWLLSNQQYDLSDTTLYFQWMAHGANTYMLAGVGARWFDEDLGIQGNHAYQNFTTHHSWAGSVVMSDDIWYYTRLTTNPADMQFTAVTCTGDYDDQGGDLFYGTTVGLSDEAWAHAPDARLQALLWDNYGGSNAWVTLGAVEVVSHACPEASSLVVWGLLGAVGFTVARWRRKRSGRR